MEYTYRPDTVSLISGVDGRDLPFEKTFVKCESMLTCLQMWRPPSLKIWLALLAWPSNEDVNRWCNEYWCCMHRVMRMEKTKYHLLVQDALPNACGRDSSAQVCFLHVLGCVHINASTSPALYGFLYTSSGKHEFACISMAAVHIHTSTGYL